MSSMPPSTAPDTSVCPLQQSKDSGGPWAGRQRGSQLEENSPHRAGEQEQQAARAFLPQSQEARDCTRGGSGARVGSQA